MQDRTEKKGTRGRPREFDPAAALAQATDVFWTQGLAATSLADLAAAMSMNRPSIASAFGDKETIYRQALDGFADATKAHVAAVLSEHDDLRDALTAFYRAALEVYFASDPAPGCFVMCTAPAEALSHPQVRNDLQKLLGDLDGILAARFERAKRDRQLPAGMEPRAAARIAQGVLHSIAIRARAGSSRASLRRMADDAVRLLAGGR